MPRTGNEAARRRATERCLAIGAPRAGAARRHAWCTDLHEEVSMDTMQTLKDRADSKSRLEGKTTKWIEKTTAAIPSGTFLVLAGGAMLGSLTLKLLGRHTTANFVGQWVPTILMLGLYNKVVKVLGSERGEAAPAY
jgi:hypothetical protein